MYMVDLLKHNLETYERMQKILQSNNKTCILQPTGTGKSFLILKLIEDYSEQGRDIVVIEPQKYIFEQLQKDMKKYELPSDHVEFITYSALGKMNDHKMEQFHSPKLVLVDEMHRAGAPKWGNGLKMMFDSFPKDCKYIGFSATPIRFLDGKRNMAEELFDGCIANEISLVDAILNRILPLPRYIAGLYTYENEVNAIVRKIQSSNNADEEKEKLLEEVSIMKRNLDKSDGISSIFKKYINQDKGKFIAFCRNIEHLQTMKTCLEEWFSEAGIEANFYEVHCKNPEKDDQFNAFKEDEKLAVCLSIAMLSEGLHGIDGVILLRDTISPNLYYQQIGRVFSVGMKTVPIIFDLVANCESIMDCSLKNDLLEAVEKRDKEKCNIDDGGLNVDKKEITKEDIENFFVFDQVVDAINSFKAIEERLVGDWEIGLKHFDKYVREHDGDVLVPLRYKDKDGFCTGTWVNSRRTEYKKNLLSKDQIAELEQRGFIWDVRKYSFEKQVADVKNFVQINGNYPKHKAKNTYEKKLAYFVTDERVSKRKAEKNNVRYPQWKMDIIEREQLYDFFDGKESGVDKFYRMALAYREKYGHTNIKHKDIIDGYHIGSAYNTLIDDCKNGKIPKEKIDTLKSVGIDITMGKHKKRYNMMIQLAKQAVSERVVISKQNQFYHDVNFYIWYIKHMKKFTNEEKRLFDQLVTHNNVNKINVKIIDTLNQNCNQYSSINEAGRALHNDFHIVKSDQFGTTVIHKRLTGKTKNPIYKGRFRFEYVEDSIS